MKHLARTGLRFTVAIPLLAISLFAEITSSERIKIDELTSAKGTYTNVEDVYRVTFPRTDVKVAIEGRSMHPFLGLTSWAAFTPHSQGKLMVMGDLVLFEDEVNPVLSAALENGLEVTALHNHFFFDSPRVMFMHIGGSGTAEQLASAVRKALDKVNQTRAAKPQPESKFTGPGIPETNAITAATMDTILGVKGQVNAGMYKAQIGRSAQMHGKSVGNQMGVNTWAAFAGTDESAFVDGDFAMTVTELQPVLRALRTAGINIVAIHNHMTHEEPQYVFLHYWGKGNAATLARGLRTALDTQQLKAAASVLFVCEHGAAKSLVASEYFNHFAAARGLAERATTRGTNIDAEFGPAIVAGLKADGITVAPGKPQLIRAEDLRGAQQVVTFAVKLPDGLPSVKQTEWNDIPSIGANFNAARDDIRNRVEKLVNEIAATHNHNAAIPSGDWLMAMTREGGPQKWEILCAPTRSKTMWCSTR